MEPNEFPTSKLSPTPQLSPEQLRELRDAQIIQDICHKIQDCIPNDKGMIALFIDVATDSRVSVVTTFPGNLARKILKQFVQMGCPGLSTFGTQEFQSPT